MIQYKGYGAEDSALSSTGGGAMTSTLFLSVMPPMYADSIKREPQISATATARDDSVCLTSSGSETKKFFMGEDLILIYYSKIIFVAPI